MKLIFFEGSDEEFKCCSALFPGAVHAVVKPSQEHFTAVYSHADGVLPNSKDEEDNYVSFEEAKTLLMRLPLLGGMRAILRKLVDAGENFVSSGELMKVNDYNRRQHRSTMAAFARRVHTTAGSKEFFVKRWDVTDGQNQYSLTPQARRALLDSGVLQ